MSKKDVLEEAKRLAADPGSYIKKVVKELPLCVHPKFTLEMRKGVYQELDVLSRRYSKVLGGLAMAYENVQLVSSRGWLFSTNPFIHIVVRAQFYVFAPEADTVIEAVVKKKTKNHIGCLVHGMFNVSISKSIGSSVDSWCGTYAQEGDLVKLAITHVTFTTFVPYIKAEFDHESVQKLMTFSIEENEDDGVSGGDNSEKRSHIVFDNDSGISSNELEPSIKCEKKRKKAKRLDFNDKALEDNASDVKKLKKVKGNKRKRSEDNFDASYIEDTDDVKPKKKKRKKDSSMYGNMNKSLDMDIKQEKERDARNDIERNDLNSTAEFRDSNHKKRKKKRSIDRNMNKSFNMDDVKDMNENEKKNDIEGNNLNSTAEFRNSNRKKRKKKQSIDGNMNKSFGMDDVKDMNENEKNDIEENNLNSTAEFRDSNHKKRKKKRSIEGNMNGSLDTCMEIKLVKERETRNDTEGENFDSLAEFRDNSHKKRKRKQSMDGHMNESLDMDDVKHRKKKQKENNNEGENVDLITEFKKDGKKKRSMDENIIESLNPELRKYERQDISKDSKGVIDGKVHELVLSKVNESPKKSKKKQMFLSINNKETDSIKYPSSNTVKENVNQFKSQRKTAVSEVESPRQTQVTIVSPPVKSKDNDTSYPKKKKSISTPPQELKGSKITPKNSSKKQHSRQLSVSSAEASALEMFAELPLPDFGFDD